MVLKSIQGLKFVPKPVASASTNQTLPNRFIATINTQLELLEKPEMEGRRWWKEQNGKLVVSFRYRNSPIVLDDKGKAFFELQNKEALAKTLKAVIKEAESGDWDEILKQKAATFKKPKGKTIAAATM